MDQSMASWASTAERFGTGNTIILATVLVLSSIFVMLEAYKEKERKGKGLVFPPGAIGLPYFIWDTIEFVRGHHRNELKQFFDKKEAIYGPVFKLSIMGDTIVLLDPPAGNKFLLGSEHSEHNLVRKAYPKSMSELTLTNSLLTLEGEAYKVVRRQLLNKFLGPESILRYVENMERHVLKHLDKHWLGTEGQEEEICTLTLINKFTFGLILELCFGLADVAKTAEAESKMRQTFPEWANGLLSMPINLPGFTFHRALKARAVLLEVVADLIVKRRQELKEGTASPDHDLLSLLLSYPDENNVWTDVSIRDNLLLLLYAGHDTSASTLTMTISDIAKHPEVYKKLIEEHASIAAKKKEGDPLKMEDLRSMVYTWQVVQETMRHTTIVPLGYRQATKDFEYNGYTIPKGWKIFWSQDRTNKQPAFHKDPETYDPSRFDPRSRVRPSPYVFLPFGAGSRICPGMEFAKMEILIFLHHFLKRFKWTLVDPNEKIFRVYMPRTKKGSPIRITKCRAF